MRRLAWVLAATVLLAGGCAKNASSPSAGGTLVIGVLSDLGNWNPYLDDTAFARDLLGLLYPSLGIELTDYREHPPSFAPALAESWSWSADHLTLDVRLRGDASWSDGVPVTAEDVVFSYRTQTAPELGWTGVFDKERIERVEALDPHTVRILFSAVYPYQLMDANEGLIVPAHAWGTIPYADWETADWEAHALSAGPFGLASHTAQQEIVLERNPRYWRRGRPLVDRVVFRVVPSQTSLFTQFASGALDFVNTVPVRDVDRVRGDPRLRLVVYSSRKYTYVGWNTSRPRLADPRVRRALGLAIDRQEILDAVQGGLGRLAVGPILRSMWAFNRALEPLPYDPDAAIRLLAEAGWRDHDDDGLLDRDGEAFRFELLANTETESRQDVALLVKSHLERVGVAVDTRFIEWGTLVARLVAGDFDAYVGTWREPTKIDLHDLWHTAPADDPLSNFVRYSNPEVDRLIEDAAEAAEVATLKPLYDRIQELVVADQPYAFLYEPDDRAGLSARVAGAVVNDASPYFNLENWRLGEATRTGRTESPDDGVP